MPQRGCIPQPKVAKLPWVYSKPYTNPEWVVFLARCNPFRVGSILLSIPKVAHSSQPWAVGLIPFGDSWKIFVLHPCLYCLDRLCGGCTRSVIGSRKAPNDDHGQRGILPATFSRQGDFRFQASDHIRKGPFHPSEVPNAGDKEGWVSLLNSPNATVFSCCSQSKGSVLAL